MYIAPVAKREELKEMEIGPIAMIALAFFAPLPMFAVMFLLKEEE